MLTQLKDRYSGLFRAIAIGIVYAFLVDGIAPATEPVSGPGPAGPGPEMVQGEELCQAKLALPSRLNNKEFKQEFSALADKKIKSRYSLATPESISEVLQNPSVRKRLGDTIQKLFVDGIETGFSCLVYEKEVKVGDISSTANKGYARVKIIPKKSIAGFKTLIIHSHPFIIYNYGMSDGSTKVVTEGSVLPGGDEFEELYRNFRAGAVGIVWGNGSEGFYLTMLTVNNIKDYSTLRAGYRHDYAGLVKELLNRDAVRFYRITPDRELSIHFKKGKINTALQEISTDEALSTRERVSVNPQLVRDDDKRIFRGYEERALLEHRDSAPQKISAVIEKTVSRLKLIARLIRFKEFDSKKNREKSAIAWDAKCLIAKLKGLRKALEIAENRKCARRFEKLIAELQQERDKIFEIHSRWKPAIVVYGSARIPEDSPIYAMAEKLGEDIFHAGYAARTGSDPSLMAAPLKGFIKARQRAGIEKNQANSTQGARIGDLPFEQEITPYAEDNYIFKHFITRKECLRKNAVGTIVLHGGIGTTDELFGVLQREEPVVLMGVKYWKPIMGTIYASWSLIGIVNRTKPILITDSNDEALEYIQKNKQKIQLDSKEKITDINEDIKNGLLALGKWNESVTFIGRPQAGSEELKMAQEVASSLILNGTAVRAGSTGVLLDSLLSCAKSIGKKDMLQATLLKTGGSKLSANEKKIEKRIVTAYSGNHQVLITENSKGLVFLPGDVKTITALFDILTLFQTGKLPRKPIVLIGCEFWLPIIDGIVNATLSFTPPLIKPEDADLFQVAETKEAALQYLYADTAKTENALPAPEIEQNMAVGFTDAVMARAASDKETPQKTIIALGTDWIPGYSASDRSSQYKYLNSLIVKGIRQYCEKKGIPFLDREDGKLLYAINKARGEKGYENAKVIVLAKASALTGILKPLKDDKNVFMMGVDASNISKKYDTAGEDYYIRIMEMLKIALETERYKDRYNENNPPPSPNIPIEFRKGFWIFIPQAERLKIEALEAIYAVQKSA